VISKRMPGEPYYASPVPRPLVREAGADPGRLRIGVLDRPDAEGLVDDPPVRRARCSSGSPTMSVARMDGWRARKI
jgi:amidase